MLWVVLKEVKCVPLVVEAYGDWEITASETFTRIARRLVIHSTHPTLNSGTKRYRHLAYPEMSHTSEDILQFFSNRILHKLTVF